jgi:hypothetical protein
MRTPQVLTNNYTTESPPPSFEPSNDDPLPTKEAAPLVAYT